MDNDNRDNLRELFGRFLGSEEAIRAAEEVERGEKLLDLYPAPQPSPRLLAGITQQGLVRLSRRHRLLHRAYRWLPAAAAVILVAMIGPLGRQPTGSSEMNYASLIPAAIWESGDINADDADLAYFNAEMDQIEAQMQALQTGDDEFADADAMDEVEMELMRIDTEFWRE